MVGRVRRQCGGATVVHASDGEAELSAQSYGTDTGMSVWFGEGLASGTVGDPIDGRVQDALENICNLRQILHPDTVIHL